MHSCFQLLKDEGYDLQKDLHQPIMITQDMQLEVEHWAIRLEKTVQQGKRTKIAHGHLLLTFCPMCGERLIPEQEVK